MILVKLRITGQCDTLRRRRSLSFWTLKAGLNQADYAVTFGRTMKALRE